MRRGVARAAWLLALLFHNVPFIGLADGFDLSQLPLVQHLQAFPIRTELGDPSLPAVFGHEGPKGIACADFDDDGLPDLAVSNLDGSVTLLINRGGGDFQNPTHLPTGSSSLREIIAADLDGDERPDLAVAAPFEGVVHLFWNEGDGAFSEAEALAAWPGARSLTSGDFDGDGIADLAAAGPGAGLRHYRGTGGGAFEVLGDLPDLSPEDTLFPKPVYALHTLRSRDGQRDELLVGYAESDAFYLLATEEPDRSGPLEPGLQRLPEDHAGSQPGAVLITEFMADNTRTIAGRGGVFHDWIELCNVSPQPLSLAGYYLTDKAGDLFKWPLPNIVMPAGAFLLVFASEVANSVRGEHHANFKLAAGGEFLALTRNGSIVHSFPRWDPEDPADTFPDQVADISYGLDHNGRQVFFPLPSPGWANNAGIDSLEPVALVALESLTLDPASPLPGQPVSVSAVLRDPGRVNTVWLTVSRESGRSALSTLMRTGPDDPARFLATLPPGRLMEDSRLEVHVRTEDGRVRALRARDAWAIPQPGMLGVVASLSAAATRSLDLAPLFSRNDRDDALPDLVSAERDANRIVIRRGLPGYQRFAAAPAQVLTVPGAPRAVRIADMDGDGWNDLVVVQRNADKVVTYRNRGGSFADPELAGDAPALPFSTATVGRSPREAALADFTGDGKPDAAVINRISNDLSLLQAAPGQVAFRRLDLVYELEGLPSGVLVRDTNGDGRDDVLLVYRGSGEISIQLARDDGTLDPPWFFPLDELPGGIEFEDCNGDGEGDFIIPDLENEGGLVLVLSDKSGGYLDPVRFDLVPGNPRVADGSNRGFLTVAMADFDGDGVLDAAASIFDCRVAFYRGQFDPRPAGEPNQFTLTLTGVHELTFEFRRIIPEDFDGDGDLDFATVGWQGDVVIVENPGDLDGDGIGDLLNVANLGPWKHIIPPVSGEMVGAEEIRSEDLDGDGWNDLVVGSLGGTFWYRGGPGLRFEAPTAPLPGAEAPASGMATVDFDGDGRTETLAVGCEDRGCLTFIRKDGEGFVRGELTVQVPAARYLASGDLDGDGASDLVGVGAGLLWTGLSQRVPRLTEDLPRRPGRAFAAGLLLNELLPRNTEIPLLSDGGKTADYLELYNNSSSPRGMEGHRLELRSLGANGLPAGEPRAFAFPSSVVVEPGGYLLAVFSESLRSEMHTGFRLPGEGGELRLLDAQGTELDRVHYPAARQNFAYGRFFDGGKRWGFNQSPTPGSANVDGGLIDPVIHLLDFDPTTLRPGHPLQFRAEAGDDFGVVGVRVIWRRLDRPELDGQLALFDDGKHGDDAFLDGVFGNTLSSGLPAGGEIAFYLEAIDLTGRTATDPGGAGNDDDDEISETHTLGVRAATDLLLSEVVTRNDTLATDEAGQTPDYVELTNTSDRPLPLGGFLLAQRLDASLDETFLFPLDAILEPGESILVFLDSNPDQGPLHAPFRIETGERLVLMTTGANGARVVADAVTVPELGPDEAWSRAGPIWERAPGSPGHPHPVALEPRMASSASGERVFAASFLTEPGRHYAVEASVDLMRWTRLDPGVVTGTGAPVTLTLPPGPGGYLRLLPLGGTSLAVDLDFGLTTRSTVEVSGILDHGAGERPAVNIFWDTVDRGADWDAWEHSVSLGGFSGSFTGLILGLADGSPYVFRARVSAGTAMAWSEPRPLETLSRDHPKLSQPVVTAITTREAAVSVLLSDAGVSEPALTLFWGGADGGGDAAAWEHAVDLPSPAAGESVSHVLEDLPPGRSVFLRIRAVNAAGAAWSPGVASFSTLSEIEALRRWLVVSEFMYHPPKPSEVEAAAGFTDEDEFEFVELHNNGPVPLDLTNITVTGDIRFSFLEHAVIRQVPPGGYLLAVRNLSAFTLRYGPDLPVAGQWCTPFACGDLSQKADEPGLLGLRYREVEQLAEFRFADRNPWPGLADGDGYSVELLDAGSRPDHADPAAWGSSVDWGGSPGRPRPGVSEYAALREYLRITELRVSPSEFEFIEIFNSGPEALDLSPLSITGGISFPFGDAEVRTLDPGATVVVVRARGEFRSLYGDEIPVAGEFAGGLSGDGEIIRIAAGGYPIVESDYTPWIREEPPGTGGHAILWASDPSGPASAWIPGAGEHGHPGAAVSAGVLEANRAALVGALRLTECRTTPASLRFFELTNAGSEILDLTGVHLSAPYSRIGHFFSGNPLRLLAPGQTLLLVANQDAFEAHYGRGLPVLEGLPDDFPLSGTVALTAWGAIIAEHLLDPRTFALDFPLGLSPQWLPAPTEDGNPGFVLDYPEREEVLRRVHYSEWLAQFDPPLPAHPQDDSDGDGMNQFLEYACGSDPLKPDGPVLQLEKNAGGEWTLSFSLRANVADVIYIIERLDAGGAARTLLRYEPGGSPQGLRILAGQAVFTLPAHEPGPHLYRLRVLWLPPSDETETQNS
ncbi:MAG TPA: FG-GAP-like repeat-containing protein [Verrucomicrobiales bacterium]|nr:FG-GAP-like repeat-containing protein [Verrucomicrobiales bacterium]